MANSRLSSLTRRSDFLRLKERGRVFHASSWLLVNYQATELKSVRYGWTIPAYVGTAVTRNRLRRWGRAFVREWTNASRPKCGVDLNFVFKRRDKTLYKTMNHVDFVKAMENSVIRLESLIG